LLIGRPGSALPAFNRRIERVDELILDLRV
jgi:hypothetical protein